MNSAIYKVIFRSKNDSIIERYYAVENYEEFVREMERLYGHLVQYTIIQVIFEFGYYPVLSKIVNEPPV